MMLIESVVVMTAMLVAAVAPAFAVTLESDDGKPTRGPVWGVPVEPTWACDTVAGIVGFEWRADGEVCWLNLPVPLPEGI